MSCVSAAVQVKRAKDIGSSVAARFEDRAHVRKPADVVSKQNQSRLRNRDHACRSKLEARDRQFRHTRSLGNLPEQIRRSDRMRRGCELLCFGLPATLAGLIRQRVYLCKRFRKVSDSMVQSQALRLSMNTDVFGNENIDGVGIYCRQKLMINPVVTLLVRDPENSHLHELMLEDQEALDICRREFFVTRGDSHLDPRGCPVAARNERKVETQVRSPFVQIE